MLTDIESLQKEIETFQNNVKYSNELTALLSNIISALKNEEKMFEEKLKMLETGVSSVPDQLKTGNQDLIQQMLDNISHAKAEYETTLQNYLDELKSVPKMISEKSDAQYGEFLTSVKKEYNGYIVALKDTQTEMEKISNELDLKYDSFLTKMEATNMDQIYRICLETNKNVNKKLTLVFAGTVAAIVLSAVALILQFI